MTELKLNIPQNHGKLKGLFPDLFQRSKILLGNILLNTRLPRAVPQPIGLFLFCIEFAWC